MNTKTQKAIVIAVAFFLVGTILNIDYAMWNEETHNEYQRYMQNIIEGNISVAIPVTKEQFEEYAREEGNYIFEEGNYTFYYFRVGKSFEEWKHDNGKLYWADLTKRLRVVAVSADQCGCNDCPTSTKREAYNQGRQDTYMLLANSYVDFCKFFTKNKYVPWAVIDDWWVKEFKDVNESKIIGRSFEVGNGITAVYSNENGAMLRYNKCGCKNEYKYIQPVFALTSSAVQQLWTYESGAHNNPQTEVKDTPPNAPVITSIGGDDYNEALDDGGTHGFVLTLCYPYCDGEYVGNSSQLDNEDVQDWKNWIRSKKYFNPWWVSK